MAEILTSTAAVNGVAGKFGQRKTMVEMQAELLKRKREQEDRDSQEPVKLEIGVQQFIERSTVTDRLVRKFGHGQKPKARLALYRRLERLADVGGQAVLDVISECVADAVGKDKPGNWFCFVVVKRLRERSLLGVAEKGDTSW